MIPTLDKLGFAEAIQAGGKPAVVDFMTDWCPYCKRLAPIIEEIAAEHADEIDVYYLNTDNEPDVAEDFDVMTVPTIFVFADGKVKGNAVNPRTKEAVLELIFE